MQGVILAGGHGTRFWPLSREEFPKQVLTLFGGRSLIEHAIVRAGTVIPHEKIFVVTHIQHAEQIRIQLPQPLHPTFLYEPVGRDTAAAIGYAAVAIRRQVGDDVMAVFSADHAIDDLDAFYAALTLGERLAQAGYLVTLGATPTRPETAYGYIQAGAPIPNNTTARAVNRFIEKPTREAAEGYLQAGNTFWNTGIFLWKASTILEEIDRHLPSLSAGLCEIEKEWGTPQGLAHLPAVYARLPAVSIDYAVLEKADRLAVIPTAMGWEDVGSWTALGTVLPQDDAGNVVVGNVVPLHSQESIFYGGERLLAVVGLDNVIVADTPDVTLVCAKGHAQEVKQVVEILKARGGDTHRTHRTVLRNWGRYTVLEERADYKIKKIVVNPHARLSLQMHAKRAEHWVVVTGTARVTVGESVYVLSANQSTFVPMGVKHRLENPTDLPLEIIEVQSGAYLGEDDIVRYADDYGRVVPTLPTAC